MKKSEKIKSIDTDRYLAESRGLERDYINEIINSKKYAWYVTIILFIVTIISLISATFAFKREIFPPVILRVDNATGAVDMLNTVKESDTTYGEIVDIYWLNKYVLNRESYDFNNIQMLYDTTALLSTEDVQKEYYQVFEGDNALDKKLSNHTRIVINIKSITPHESGGSAVVRFTKQEVSSNARGHVDNLIATIGYVYKNVQASSQDLRINPLGFQVSSYRVDTEIINQ